MKYLKSIKNYFYSEEKKQSKDQIKEDFGKFPPFPLICSDLNIEFNIVRVNWFGSILYKIKNIYKFFDENNLNKINSEHKHLLIKIQNEFHKSKNSYKDFNDEIKKLKNQEKIGALIILILLSPLLIVLTAIFLIYLSINIVILFYKIHKRERNVLGYFFALNVNENRIIIKKVPLKNNDELDAIISHEHIHFLQNINFELNIKDKRCSNILFVKESKISKYFIYICERNEVEARLHEIIISYYRLINELPLTKKGFIEILARNNKFGKTVIESMDWNNQNFEKFSNDHQERYASFSTDMYFILNIIKNNYLQRRFICEVLTVMYGNLLKYYGDEKSSKLFLEKINRPNLYDQIYAPQDY